MIANFALVAHQGGWDEILMVVGPLVVVVGLLYWARSRQQNAASDTDGATD
jgi:hypothetical protein